MTVAAFVATVFGTSSHAQQSYSDAQLHGNWNCKLSAEENGTRIQLEYIASYARDGKSNNFGTLKLKAANAPEMVYSTASSAKWKLKGRSIEETIEDTRISSISHPESSKTPNLPGLFPKSGTKSSEILELSASTMKLRSGTDGSVIACSKR
ncbi:hypothetical protein IAI53_07335 [Thauera sp. CAU 1555]|uniref:Uncharacterized protein n=1 Tax=Thauera sedimentorum TaxID=2767595 RepID=A0ABR9B8L3_9RHOO|nr:hypothetical protein [Thauera sedimentorum]MBC9071777.1 hypothetical protein [Thauera sedimentorum]MBD8502696.1 hypothetical protein [Thauera sedimentorum]